MAVYLSDMDNHLSVHRGSKRKRTSKGRRVIAEGDDITADGILVRTVTRHTEQGSVQNVRSRPVWLNENKDPETAIADVPDSVMHIPENAQEHRLDHPEDFPEDPDFPTMPNNAKTQQYYLQEFVKRADPLLQALLSREVPASPRCSHCADECIARWRCRDCTSGTMLCRRCMRLTHFDNPLHRIELWKGTYFQRAELWQVGLYILVPHHTGERLCLGLKWNQRLLNGFQVTKDAREQAELSRGGPDRQPDDLAEARGSYQDCSMGNNDEHPEHEVDFEGHLGDQDSRPDLSSAMDDEMLDQDNNDEDEAMEPPADYLPSILATPEDHNDPSWTVNLNAETDIERPRADALDNPFVRVIHTNGVHCIAVVSCSCRGKETTHSDLMASRMIPTSFVRYRTMFTHAVLDDFRLTNLECKASAYQYFQKLRRLTSPMQPESVPNLYHGLRRISRLWRWMKKLKWAGSRSTSDTPVAGSLANFCPTCPQPGINLPDNWKLDPERYTYIHTNNITNLIVHCRWVYQRSFVADGNFKADHVRQKNSGTDVALYEGLGMMALDSDYQEFLTSAINRPTVSVPDPDGTILTVDRKRPAKIASEQLSWRCSLPRLVILLALLQLPVPDTGVLPQTAWPICTVGSNKKMWIGPSSRLFKQRRSIPVKVFSSFMTLYVNISYIYKTESDIFYLPISKSMQLSVLFMSMGTRTPASIGTLLHLSRGLLWWPEKSWKACGPCSMQLHPPCAQPLSLTVPKSWMIT